MMIGIAIATLHCLKKCWWRSRVIFGRDAGVMSHGLRLLEERLAEEKKLQRRVDRLRGAMREGRKGRIAKKQA